MIVYCITNKINGKQYVGVTKRDVKRRFAEHSGSDSYIGRAIRKHGKHNFDVSIIEEVESMEQMWQREIYWIKKKNTFAKGYNRTDGGIGAYHDNKISVNLSERQKKFVLYVRRKNKEVLDINDDYKMIESVVLNILLSFVVANKTKDKMKSAKLLSKLKPIYLEDILKSKVITQYELNEWIA